MKEVRDRRGCFARNKKGQCPPHWWIINSNEVGHCRFCPAVKDFGALLRKESKRLSHFGKLRYTPGHCRKERKTPPAAA